MDNEIIGKKVKALMIIKNIKRSELAEKLGITYNTLTRKLNGREEFYINEILKMKDIFDMDIELCARVFFYDNL